MAGNMSKSDLRLSYWAEVIKGDGFSIEGNERQRIAYGIILVHVKRDEPGGVARFLKS